MILEGIKSGHDCCCYLGEENGPNVCPQTEEGTWNIFDAEWTGLEEHLNNWGDGTEDSRAGCL